MKPVSRSQLPPKEELLEEFKSGSIPRSETWQTLIHGLYLNNEQVAEIEEWYNTILNLSEQNQIIHAEIQVRHDQIEIWHGDVDLWQQQVTAEKDIAVNSAASAKASEQAAAGSENKAKASETAAASSEGHAKASETAASNSETASATSEGSAKASETKAADSATAAGNSETNAKASKTAASDSETAAAAFEASAKNSETLAADFAKKALSHEKKAKLWAEEKYETPVEPNQFSAFHWAKVAEQYAGSLTNGMYFAGRWDLKDGLPGTPTDNLVPWYRIIDSDSLSSSPTSEMVNDFGQKWRTLVDNANPGDQIVWDPLIKEWFLIDCSDEVWLVNGKKGNVILNWQDIEERPETVVPIGSCMMWPIAVAPLGWVEAKGQSTSGMNQAIKDLYGNNLPDMRGEFPRGWDNGRGVDSDRNRLSSQSDLIKSHVHDASFSGNSVSGHTHSRGTMNITGNFEPRGYNNAGALTSLTSISGAFSQENAGSTRSFEQNNSNAGSSRFIFDASKSWTGATSSAGSHTPSGSVSVSNTGGSETRPRNIAWVFIIFIGYEQ